MEKKSLEEIWNQMEQKRLFEKQTVEQKETELYEQRETARKEYMKVMRMYEASSSLNSVAAAAAGAGGTKKNYFITTTNTVWLYPIVDTEYALAGTTYSYTRIGNNIICQDQATLIAIYLEIYARTAVTQPVGNEGYTLGVGTIVRDLKQELNFKINDQLMVTWRLVEQITSQSDVTVGGNSPDGTIGYTTLIENWPDPLPDSGLDLALLIDYNY
jgi:hypothetical protein